MPVPEDAAPPPPLSPDIPALRQVALACAVLHDVDLEPYAEGVVLRGGPPVELSWEMVAHAVAGHPGTSRVGQLRFLALVRCARAGHDLAPAELLERVRPVGLPADHALHPGSAWVREAVLGGALELGLGLLGVGPDPDTVVPLVTGRPPARRGRPTPWVEQAWARAAGYLERMGAVAAERARREPAGVLRPIGDCDVVTLLGSRRFRAVAAARDGTGLCGIAVPMRRRGWLDLARIDPAFVLAAAVATAPEDRGFDRPLLVTADEVTLPPRGGRPAEIVLRDPAARDPELPAVRWR